MEDIRRRKGKVNCGKLEGEMNHGKLWTLRNKLWAWREGEWGVG